MHDYFDILGLPEGARASEVRRACQRRVRRSHPDFRFAERSIASAVPAPPMFVPSALEIAVDFVDALAFVERIEAAFFAKSAERYNRDR